MKMLIAWCKNHISLIIAFSLLPFTILLGWLAYRLCGLEVIKAFGPVYTSLFMIYIAYGQLKISKDQATLAQQKKELEVRDKRYDIYRLWNKEYSNFINCSSLSNPTYIFNISYENLLLVSDEFLYAFSEETLMANLFQQLKTYYDQKLKTYYDQINKIRKEWDAFEYDHVSNPELGGCALLHPNDINGQQDYDDQKIYDVRHKMNEVRKELLKLAVQKMKIL